ncbi:hypothetical protein [Yoonia sp. BS5-3]|uniref:Uncharacterized protein n=1 Tax=Yoonia phaeophyticola TaxID=3137369 RepID=A0ABZ2V1W0_9RHOB
MINFRLASYLRILLAAHVFGLGGALSAFAEECPEIWGPYEAMITERVPEAYRKTMLFADPQRNLFNCISADVGEDAFADLAQYMRYVPLDFPAERAQIRIEGSLLLPHAVCSIGDVQFFGHRYFLVVLPVRSEFLETDYCRVRIDAVIDNFENWVVN